MVGHLRSLSLGRLRRIRSPELEAECKSICRLAAEHDLTVAWLWCKREEPIMQVCKALPCLPCFAGLVEQANITAGAGWCMTCLSADLQSSLTASGGCSSCTGQPHAPRASGLCAWLCASGHAPLPAMSRPGGLAGTHGTLLRAEQAAAQVADYLSRRSPDMQLEERLYLQRLTSMTQAAPCEPVQLFAPQLDCFVHI